MVPLANNGFEHLVDETFKVRKYISDIDLDSLKFKLKGRKYLG
jgi:hypothetical protein